jgi:hypothetical protein
MMVDELRQSEERESAVIHIYFFLEQAEGYVNALEKSTFRPSTIREVFEHCAQND